MDDRAQHTSCAQCSMYVVEYRGSFLTLCSACDAIAFTHYILVPCAPTHKHTHTHTHYELTESTYKHVGYRVHT